jgi:hypothetical protein
VPGLGQDALYDELLVGAAAARRLPRHPQALGLVAGGEAEPAQMARRDSSLRHGALLSCMLPQGRTAQGTRGHPDSGASGPGGPRAGGQEQGLSCARPPAAGPAAACRACRSARTPPR